MAVVLTDLLTQLVLPAISVTDLWFAEMVVVPIHIQPLVKAMENFVLQARNVRTDFFVVVGAVFQVAQGFLNNFKSSHSCTHGVYGNDFFLTLIFSGALS